ncbi:NAD(P)-dependent dehydrogenase (short-subunit alcohol dehydrogenase family) [Paucimonas lemoignei]|uniref:NAD(P)-dependent dehydrogenase (Short-subunit alcohol dehydrogenase family) n=2 Tax=Paucimonas lemoignei TaxID=29443 RepID=A0A4V2UIA8_PAULE|nr:NAD(P)-dependent dehydrogenase (short-subunit alcohol dehydrogenase family) [Paucimonas lemoignei]
MRTLSQLMSLEGRLAVITGGAGHLGRAMADALAELGCSVCLLDRNRSALRDAQEQLQARWQTPVATLEIDLEAESERAAVAAWITEKFGRADILINNAGFVGDSQLRGWVVPFEEQAIDTWRRALEVNLTAAFHLSQVLTPLLRTSGHGSIINVGSIYGVVGPDLRLYEGTPMGNPAAYAASKGGLLQATKWLASVLGPDVRVNAISPGGIARNQPEAFARRYEQKTPLRRMGLEEDFKGAVAYFASDLSAWVTGENLMVDGG